jgi:hypothetical protein
MISYETVAVTVTLTSSREAEFYFYEYDNVVPYRHYVLELEALHFFRAIQ